MKVFSSTLNTAGKSVSGISSAASTNAEVLKNAFSEAFTNTAVGASQGNSLDTEGLKYNAEPDIVQFLNRLDISANRKERLTKRDNLGERDLNSVQDAMHMGTDVYAVTNKYRGYFKNAIVQANGIVEDRIKKQQDQNRYTEEQIRGGDGRMLRTANEMAAATGPTAENLTMSQPLSKQSAVVSPSIFNPYYAVKALGITDSVPLLDTMMNGTQFNDVTEPGSTNKPIDRTVHYTEDINDCSIKRLVELSKRGVSPLGQARYKYSDFMYCKEVGQMPNNHMITLRRFAGPVHDNIFRNLSAEGSISDPETAGDIGRMVTWFGTEDNKLESIMNYSFHASWKELHSDYENQKSKETDSQRGLFGRLLKFTNPDATAKGIDSGLMSANYDNGDGVYANNEAMLGEHFDGNKVYEPHDTVRSTHIYDGELLFNHEFTLTFNYKLRAYDNINPKSAFLDLIGNVLATTYRNGAFWAGERNILGVQPATGEWQKLNSIIEGMDDTFFEQMNGQNITYDALASAISASIREGGKEFLNSTNPGQFINDIIQNGSGGGASRGSGESGGQESGNFLKDTLNKFKSGLGSVADMASVVVGKEGKVVKEMLTMFLKQQFGIPSMYAFKSLLSGDAVGTWHVTIGNPLNPIAAFGNLIIEDVKVQHSGPLGFDDFPTELKVTVTLKHATPRDSVDISKMYTKGSDAIYIPIPKGGGFMQSDITNIGSNMNSELPAEYTGWIGDSSIERIAANRQYVSR